MKTERGVLMFHNPNTKLEGENIIKLLKKLQHRGQDSSGIGLPNDSIKTRKHWVRWKI